MIMKEYKIIKVKLDDEEKEALLKVQNFMNDIYVKSHFCSVQFEGNIASILDDLQDTINCFIK